MVFGGRKLKPAIETGVAAVKRADGSLKLLLGLAVATVVLAACTLAAVLGMRAARA